MIFKFYKLVIFKDLGEGFTCFLPSELDISQHKLAKELADTDVMCLAVPRNYLALVVRNYSIALNVANAIGDLSLVVGCRVVRCFSGH